MTIDVAVTAVRHVSWSLRCSRTHSDDHLAAPHVIHAAACWMTVVETRARRVRAGAPSCEYERGVPPELLLLERHVFSRHASPIQATSTCCVRPVVVGSQVQSLLVASLVLDHYNFHAHKEGPIDPGGMNQGVKEQLRFVVYIHNAPQPERSRLARFAFGLRRALYVIKIGAECRGSHVLVGRQ